MGLKKLSIIAGILLLLAIPSIWPYGYYIFLRWVIFGSSIFVVYRLSKISFNYWVLAFGIITFLFNPIFPIYLNKFSWVVIDLVSAFMFFKIASDRGIQDS